MQCQSWRVFSCTYMQIPVTWGHLCSQLAAQISHKKLGALKKVRFSNARFTERQIWEFGLCFDGKGPHYRRAFNKKGRSVWSQKLRFDSQSFSRTGCLKKSSSKMGPPIFSPVALRTYDDDLTRSLNSHHSRPFRGCAFRSLKLYSASWDMLRLPKVFLLCLQISELQNYRKIFVIPYMVHYERTWKKSLFFPQWYGEPFFFSCILMTIFILKALSCTAHVGCLDKDPSNHILIWVCPKIGVPQNGWFIMENTIKNGWFGVPLFLETSICRSKSCGSCGIICTR